MRYVAREPSEVDMGTEEWPVKKVRVESQARDVC
jgi:hypothetical protein